MHDKRLLVSGMALIFCLISEPAFGAVGENNSLFYIHDSAYTSSPLTIFLFLTFGLVLLAVLNMFFSWQRSLYIMGSLETRFLSGLNRGGKRAGFEPVNSKVFSRSFLESTVKFGSITLLHNGLYLFYCDDPKKISAVVCRVAHRIISSWQRSLLYVGRNEAGLMKDILLESDRLEDDIRAMGPVLSESMLILPLLNPDPAQVDEIVAMQKDVHTPGSVILEDMGYESFSKLYSEESSLNRLGKIAEIRRIPIIIVTCSSDGYLYRAIWENESLRRCFDGVVHLKVGKGNEIYAVSERPESGDSSHAGKAGAWDFQ